LVLLLLITLVTGIILGGYLFSNTRPRSVLALNKCAGTCLQSKELLGLLTSVGIQNFPSLLPSVVKETDKTIVIEHPNPQARIHYLLIPKRDIKNLGELSAYYQRSRLPDRDLHAFSSHCQLIVLRFDQP
jgi:hypothetical protein